MRDAAPGRRGLSSVALLAFGAVLVLLGAGVFGYARLADWQHQRQQPAGPQEVLAATLAPPSAADSRGAPAPVAARAIPAQDPEGRPVRLNIPRIGVDSAVVAMGVQNNEYQVPSFDVGHHADSANPGALGNSVYNGHLETIDAGRVFARLHQLAVGDAVYVYSPKYRFDWVVQEVRTVPNTENSFVLPSDDTRITLYTCAGAYDPRAHDYSHRLVVIGRLVQTTPRA